jgi:hypothetical protein
LIENRDAVLHTSNRLSETEELSTCVKPILISSRGQDISEMQAAVFGNYISLLWIGSWKCITTAINFHQIHGVPRVFFCKTTFSTMKSILM